jgi:hypothetical protein
VDWTGLDILVLSFCSLYCLEIEKKLIFGHLGIGIFCFFQESCHLFLFACFDFRPSGSNDRSNDRFYGKF